MNRDHLQPVSKRKIAGLVTILSHEKMEAVSRAVTFAPDI